MCYTHTQHCHSLFTHVIGTVLQFLQQIFKVNYLPEDEFSASLCFKYPSTYINNNYDDDYDDKGLCRSSLGLWWDYITNDKDNESHTLLITAGINLYGAGVKVKASLFRQEKECVCMCECLCVKYHYRQCNDLVRVINDDMAWGVWMRKETKEC